MTHHLMGRPIPSAVGTPAYGPALAGATAALVGLAVTAVPVLVLWVLSPFPQDTAADAARLAGGLWLLAHGGPLTRGGGAPLSLTPLLLTLLIAVLPYRAGARAARTAGARTRGVPAAFCAGYLAVALPVALECATPGALRARPLPDLLAVAALCYASTALGARVAPRPPRWWARARQWAGPLPGWARPTLPAWARPAGGAGQILRAAAAGLLTLLAGGALLVAVAVLLRTDSTGPSVRGLTGGSIPGAAGLLLTCLLLLPDAVVWSAAYALGPGFLLGTGTVVAPGRVVLGAVPDFPLLALAPATASPWQGLAYAVPLLAGAVCAALLGRASAERPGDGRAPWHPAATVAAGLGAALAVGVATAFLAWLAGGSLGNGRMSALGPPLWWSGAAATGWLAAVTVPGAPAVRWWLLRRTAPPDQPPTVGEERDLPAPAVRWWLLRRAAPPDQPPTVGDEGEPRPSRWRGALARTRRAVTFLRRRDR